MWQNREEFVNTLRHSQLSATELKLLSEFRVPFNVASTAFYLNVHIPEQFPSHPIAVTLSPPARHPLLNDKFQVVGSPALNGVSLLSNLGQVISDTIEDLKKPAPIVISNNNSDNDAATCTYLASAPCIPSPPQVQYLAFQPERIVLPEDLLSKDADDLSSIISSESEMFELLCRIPRFTEINKALENAVSETEAMTRDNLAMEPLMAEKRDRLLSSVQQIERLSQELVSSKAALANIVHSLGPEAQYYNTQVAVLEADEECEQVAKLLLTRGISVTEFIDQYQAKRQLYHSRKAKQEQLARMLRHGPSS